MEVDRHNMTARPAVSWEMLEKSLAHSHTLIREKAIETAGRFDDSRALMALQVAVRDSDPRIRAAAAQAFVVAASRRSIAIDSALSQLITSASDDELRSFLIQNALTSGSEILLRAVIACLVDSAPAIRDAAEKVLNERGGSWQVSQAAADTVPVIEGARTAFNAQVSAAAVRWCEQLQRAQIRRTAAVALGDLKWQPLTEEELVRWYVAMSRWDAAVECGSVSLEPLLHAAEHSSAPTRARALEAVAQLRNVRSIPSVVAFLQSSAAEVRRAAANALKVLEWVPANNEQAIGHALELEDWSAAIAFGAEAVRPLMAALKDCQDQSQRSAAIISAMKQFVDPRTAQELLPFCRDGEVSAAAVSALHSLLERRASELSVDALKSLADLKNVMQFKFAVDPQFARPVG